MSRFGLLYEKLVVMPGQKRWSAYYMLVQEVISEMKEEFPADSSHDFGDGLYHEWYEKWFGSPEKKEVHGVQDDSMFSIAWGLYGGRMLGVDDFRLRSINFGR